MCGVSYVGFVDALRGFFSRPAADRSVIFLVVIGQRPGRRQAGGRREPGNPRGLEDQLILV